MKKTKFGRLVESVASFITTYQRSSFLGFHHKTEWFETATACIKRLGSWTSKDLEFAAMLDRCFEPPTIVEINLGASGAATIAHTLARAPRIVTVLGVNSDNVEDVVTKVGFLISGWNDTNISIVGTPLLGITVACYR